MNIVGNLIKNSQTDGLYIKTSTDDNSWRRFRPMTRGRYAMEALAWIALGLIVGAIAMAVLGGCDAATPPAPDAELPVCPTTCTGLCHADGRCTCDGMACQREHHGFGDAGVGTDGGRAEDRGADGGRADVVP